MRRMGRNGATSAEIEAIYRERFRAFLLTVTALLRDGDAALDAVQEGFSVALHRRWSFRREGNLEAWLWRIVLNVARDRLRSLRREATFEESTASLEMGGPDDDVRASLLSLAERQRLAVFLRYYADLSYEQIADALGVRVGTVAASLNAARKSLRRALQEVVK
jgi:RNA polymerase sigma-70 factor, ECF subfamily